MAEVSADAIDGDRGRGQSPLRALCGPERPSRFVFVEHWVTAEARQKHPTEGPHIQNFHAHGAINVERTEFAHMLSRICMRPHRVRSPMRLCPGSYAA
jgi:2-polyprenyl-6-methoxyphenol hydroxylase-like FAD-dependent oxidoreductase